MLIHYFIFHFVEILKCRQSSDKIWNLKMRGEGIKM